MLCMINLQRQIGKAKAIIKLLNVLLCFSHPPTVIPRQLPVCFLPLQMSLHFPRLLQKMKSHHMAPSLRSPPLPSPLLSLPLFRPVDSYQFLLSSFSFRWGWKVILMCTYFEEWLHKWRASDRVNKTLQKRHFLTWELNCYSKFNKGLLTFYFIKSVLFSNCVFDL